MRGLNGARGGVEGGRRIWKGIHIGHSDTWSIFLLLYVPTYFFCLITMHSVKYGWQFTIRNI